MSRMRDKNSGPQCQDHVNKENEGCLWSDNPAVSLSCCINLSGCGGLLRVVLVSQSLGDVNFILQLTPPHAPTLTARRPISCRPAVKIFACIMHEAESPERRQESGVH